MPDLAVWSLESWSLDGLSTLDWHAGPDPTLLLLLAIVADLLLGGTLQAIGLAPSGVLAAAARYFERRLNRAKRGEAARLLRGLLALTILAGVAALAGWAVLRFLRPLPYGWGVELLFVVLLLDQRASFERAWRIARALGRGRADQARALLGGCDRAARDFTDDHGLARAAIENLALNLVHGLLGPVFWYLLLGLPGLFAYRAVEVFDGVGARRDPARRLAFGLAAARLDFALSYLPARFAGALVVVASLFAPSASPLGALRVIATAPKGPLGSNAGWSLGAFAGALGLALAGPSRRMGRPVSAPWLGEGRARAGPADIRRAVMLDAVAGLLAATLVALLAASRRLV